MIKLKIYFPISLFVLLFTAGPLQMLYAQTPVLYGLTNDGGSNGMGAIICFNLSTDSEAVIQSLGNGLDGEFPEASLVYDPYEKLFYATESENYVETGFGEIISFDPYTGEIMKQCDFDDQPTGLTPTGNLIPGPNSLYYGTTSTGGAYTGFNGYGGGTLFSFNPTNKTKTCLWSFNVSPDVSAPYGDLVYDNARSLFYGMASSGGTTGWGAIFSFDLSTGRDSVLWSFDVTTDGGMPFGNLVYCPQNGLYYGMTSQGGASPNSNGTIISFDPSTGRDSLLWSFGADSDGSGPNGSLIFNSANGLFYGMTVEGGIYSAGTIFSFDPATDRDSVLWSFKPDSTDGQDPYGNLLYDPQTNLFYGMTYYGGKYGGGTIFSFDLSNGTEKLLWGFGNGEDGRFPLGNLVMFTQYPAGIKPMSDADALKIYPNPSEGVFTLAAHLASASDISISVIDITGGVVYETSENAVQDINRSINLSDIAPGIYIVRLKTDEGSVNRRLVIQ